MFAANKKNLRCLKLKWSTTDNIQSIEFMAPVPQSVTNILSCNKEEISEVHENMKILGRSFTRSLNNETLDL